MVFFEKYAPFLKVSFVQCKTTLELCDNLKFTFGWIVHTNRRLGFRSI